MNLQLSSIAASSAIRHGRKAESSRRLRLLGTRVQPSAAALPSKANPLPNPLLAELEVAKEEALAAAELRKELEARAAAMVNLESQLEQVELLREEELKAASSRFAELESALGVAERSMEAESELVSELESKVSSMSKDLKAAAGEISALEDLLEAAQRAERNALQQAGEEVSEAESLRRAAAKESAAAAALLEKAETATAALGLHLAAGGSSKYQTMVNGEGSGPVLSEADAEALLDELDLLRGELEAELQTSEAAIARAENAEAESEALRKQLGQLASVGDDGVAAMGGFSQTLVQELATARAETAAAVAATHALEAMVDSLKNELEALRGEQATLGGKGPDSAKIAALEAANAELRDEARRREAALIEGRAFLAAILQQHASSGGGEQSELETASLGVESQVNE